MPSCPFFAQDAVFHVEAVPPVQRHAGIRQLLLGIAVETVLRVGFIYLLLMVLLRLLGKRELSQLSPLELVMLLLIPELVAQGIVGEDISMTNALVALATLLSMV